EPALGGTSGNDSTLIYAENYALAFPSNVRYVNAVLSGSNNQVDFNNMGFTGIASPAPIPEPETVALMVVGLLGVAGMSLRRRSKN
ncbi:MAG: PEP-CTERM sorting domain-containing protein, partial [Burkholderiales bacterium]|nr:PEP-CTERM sorting domain-containing protein [Burkholderiales bacterium]